MNEKSTIDLGYTFKEQLLILHMYILFKTLFKEKLWIESYHEAICS